MTSLTSGADALTGTGSNDTFTGDGADLSAADTINGNGGSDTLSLTFAGARTISSAQLSGLTSVETLDVSFGGSATTIVMNPDAVTRADLDQFAVLFGTGDLSLDVSAVTSGQVFVGGAGQVTLQNTGAQNLWVASGYTGHIAGSTSDDTLYGASGADTLSGGDGNDYIDGSTGNDTIDGGNGDDTLYGGSSGDAITGGAGDDVIDGGASSDTIDAGDGNDLITCNAGNDTVAGGLGTDVFTIGASSGNTTITDFSTATTYELIDLSEISAATDLAALSVSGSTNATFTIGGHTVTLTGVNACCLTAANFIFYNDPKVYTVAAGTDEDIIQHLIDTVPDGSTIHLNSGDFTFDKTLHIQRNNITLEGDSSGTTIHSWIASEIHTASQTTPGSTIAVESLNKAQTGIAYLTSNAAECDTVLHLNTTAGIVAGSIIYIAQSNDEDYLEETGNTQYDPGASPRYYLREFAVRVSAVSGSDVTIELPLPYSFTSGSGNAYIALEQPITGVHVDDLTIANEIKSAGPVADSYTNDLGDAWNSIATVNFDMVADSGISNVSVTDSGSHVFRFQRTYNITGTDLSADGAYNKGADSNGYAFYFNESFNDTFSGLTALNTRHGVLFSAESAENYNTIQVDNTNRDINFHGSADSHNTITVDEADLSDHLWPAVGPGSYPLHPKSRIDLNTVTFGNLTGSDQDEVVYAKNGGATIDAAGGNDALHGGSGADTLTGGTGNDLLDLGNGDTGTGGDGYDTFVIAAGSDVTITDFDATHSLERIDLSGVGGANDFSALTIAQAGTATTVTVGTTTVTLDGFTASTLSAANFIFYGQDDMTVARSWSTRLAETGTLGSGTDVVAGDPVDNAFQCTTLQINSGDSIDGGDGVDVLRLTGTGELIDAAALASLTSVEYIDYSQVGTGGFVMEFAVDATVIGQAGGVLKIYGGTSNVLLTTTSVTANQLIVDTAGTVTLKHGSAVTLGDMDNGTIVGSSDDDTVHGGARADTISGGSGNDMLSGGLGNDLLDGGNGNDAMTGGVGDDTYVVDSASDTVTESSGQGTDLVQSSITCTLGSNLENLTLTGAGNINGTGNSLANAIVGNSGNNLINGGAGNDSMSGGAGDDTYVVDSTSDVVTESSGGGTDLIQSSVTYTLGSYVDNLTLTGTGNISGTGNNDNNFITGNTGQNTLTGNDGNDTLDAKGVGAGSPNGIGDTLIGGLGDDLYRVYGGETVTEGSGAGSGTDTILTSASWTLGSNFENLTLTGALGSNLSGTGNSVANVIIGDGNDNALDGDGGNDSVRGGKGADSMTGGSGNDTFVFESASNNGLDHLADFVSGTDRLSFKATDYGFSAGHTLAGGELSLTGSPSGTNAQFVYDPSTHTLYWDSNGSTSGGATAIMVFDNFATPATTDFMFT